LIAESVQADRRCRHRSGIELHKFAQRLPAAPAHVRVTVPGASP
jgi:hypothetical protein